MQVIWASEHSEALREYLAKGMSFSKIADAINAKFKTSYTRNATLGRATRMGLAGPGRTEEVPKHPPAPQPERFELAFYKPRERSAPEFIRPIPIFPRTETAKLRCVEIDPRHLSFMELERGDCRYPYGGDTDGEAITFCGHPRREGSSYCTPHFYLTCGPGTAAERSACSVLFRILRDARRARTETDAETRVAR